MKGRFPFLPALALTLALAAAGCGKAETYELALITDYGTITDKSFNQASWEGLVRYAEENDVTHKYYQPAALTREAYMSAIATAVRGGAKLIVTPGYQFAEPIYAAQDLYPDVRFILVDTLPNDGDYENGPNYKTGSNTVSVTYAEEQAGFLAGYAAVKDGYRRLGFMGGMDQPPVVAFGFGFLQGAEYAADALGLEPGEVNVRYHYAGTFDMSDVVRVLAASWYNDGTEVVFAAAGEAGASVMAAAQNAGAKVIGVDVDQSHESPTVITSAMKGLEASVYECIKEYYDGRFPGGQNLVFSAVNDGVGLPMPSSRFTQFSQADYNAMYRDMQLNRIRVERGEGFVWPSESELALDIIIVTEVR
jgi:basic membrane protein A